MFFGTRFLSLSFVEHEKFTIQLFVEYLFHVPNHSQRHYSGNFFLKYFVFYVTWHFVIFSKTNISFTTGWLSIFILIDYVLFLLPRVDSSWVTSLHLFTIKSQLSTVLFVLYCLSHINS